MVEQQTHILYCIGSSPFRGTILYASSIMESASDYDSEKCGFKSYLACQGYFSKLIMDSIKKGAITELYC